MTSATSRRGFTLVELMIVVAIVGILGTLAYVGVRHYVGASKSAEARNSVGAIAKDAAMAYDRGSSSAAPVFAGQASGMAKALCGKSNSSVPTAFADVQGKKYQSTPLDWAADAPYGAGFACLGFQIDQPQYYMYSYDVTGAGTAIGNSFTAIAQGDVTGNGSTSSFTLSGVIASGAVINIAPGITEKCAGRDCPDM